jgi:UDP-N-acetylmuramoyl-tripeptide--D-alanyl-D-alanine ligase
MNLMQISTAAEGLEAEYIGEDVSFSGVSTDTRSIAGGELFVALRGEHFDGHDFLDEARKRGAVAAMVSRRVEMGLPLLLVDDTRLGLGKLASLWRSGCPAAMVAVTGSNGKTTAKEMVAAILRQRGPVLATVGNLNNDIGVPLTLLRLRDEHQFAVVEMGANHPGEIDYLTRMARPDVALITNAAAAHLAGFGDIQGVARAKGEIFAGLSEDGVAVINHDDAMASIWRKLASHVRVVTFGLSEGADVGADWHANSNGSRMCLRTPAGELELQLPLPGRHNVMNALAATAAALSVGAEMDHVRSGLESLQPVRGRLQFRAGAGGFRILDDTYNANPGSLQAALDVLASCGGEKWLVLGDMGELGGDSAWLHEEAGRQARLAGVDRLYTLGFYGRYAVPAFGEGAQHFSDWQELVATLRHDLGANCTLLVKGSRAMQMERIVDALLEEGNSMSVESRGA